AQEDDWLDKRLAAAPPLTLVGGGRQDPTYNRVSGHIHGAVGQFDAVNPAMEHPNVLAIVNGEKSAGFTDLIQVFTGNAYCVSGAVIPMFREYSEGRIREEKLRVHLYLGSMPQGPKTDLFQQAVERRMLQEKIPKCLDEALLHRQRRLEVDS